MTPKRLLDSYGFLLYLQKEGAYDIIKTLFHEAQDEGQSVLINEMSVGEVFSVIARKHSLEEADALLPLMEVLPIRVVNNGLDDFIEAARWRVQHGLSFQNALVAATAGREGATLMTGDSEFRSVEGLISIEWLNDAE